MRLTQPGAAARPALEAVHILAVSGDTALRLRTSRSPGGATQSARMHHGYGSAGLTTSARQGRCAKPGCTGKTPHPRTCAVQRRILILRPHDPCWEVVLIIWSIFLRRTTRFRSLSHRPREAVPAAPETPVASWKGILRSAQPRHFKIPCGGSCMTGLQLVLDS